MKISKISDFRIKSNDGKYSINFAYGDFNGDKIFDFIVASMSFPTSQDINAKSYNPPHIIIRNTDGTFSEKTLQVMPIAADVNQIDKIVAADINSDGITDLFIANGGSDAPNGSRGDTNKIYISNNNQLILSEFPKNYTSFFHYINIGDVNNDGNADVFFTSAYTQVSSLLLMNKSGGLTESSDLLPSGLRDNVNLWPMTKVVGSENDYVQNHVTFMSSQLVDLNSDGFLDLFMFPHTGDSEYIFFNNGKGDFSQSQPVKLNVSFANASPAYSYSEWKYINQKFVEQKTLDSSYMFYDSVVMDVNNDGRNDIIALATYDKSSVNWITGARTNEAFHQGTWIQILINNGNGVTDETTIRVEQPSVVMKDSSNYPYLRAVDLNGDGFKDLIFTCTTDIKPDTYELNWLGSQITRFFLNDGSGHFKEYSEINLPNSNYYPMPVDGKLAFVSLTNYEEQSTDDMLVSVWKTDTPWTIGDQGNNFLYPTNINDVIDGDAGSDTLILSGKLNEYRVTTSDGNGTITDLSPARDGTNTLKSIEHLRFLDFCINTNVQAKAASAPQADVTRLVELYTAFFNRVPDADGMSFWIDEMKSGKTINQVAESFYNAGVNYASLTGFTATMTNTDFINVIYKNVLGRKDGADESGLKFWNDSLSAGQASRGTLVTDILNAAHTFKGNTTWGWVADLLDNKITVAKKFSIDMGLNYNTPEESISKGMAIASAITPTDTTAAVTLIGLSEANLHLT